VGQGRISLGSPLGRALLNRSVGDEIEVQTPKGKRRYQIVDLVTIHEKSQKPG
jgi:transcription elongation factor GreA